jgi:hypothetical protein
MADVIKYCIQPDSKATSSDSIESQLANMLGQLPSLLQPSHVNKHDDDESAVMESLDTCEELRLPPPLPFFDRRSSAPPSLLRMDGILSRGRSHSPDRTVGRPGREILRSMNMTQSMPSLQCSRSLHNRGVGCSLSKSSECGGGMVKHLLHARVQEFEQLLDDL